MVLCVFHEVKLEMERVECFNQHLVNRAHEMEGTCTAEYGIDMGKKSYIAQERPTAVEIMTLVKGALDPKNIMNPDKVL